MHEPTDPASPPLSPTAPPASPPPSAEERQQERRVERVLTQELGAVETPEAAERVAGELERLAAGMTAGAQGERAAQEPGTAAENVEAAAAREPGPECAAAVLAEAAAQVVAPTPEAPEAARAAGSVLPPTQEAPTPEAQRGRRLLREAMLRRMDPLHRLDTQIFLAVNSLPHPPIANVLADGITMATSGGWIWLIGLGIARLAGVPKSRTAFRVAAPSVIGATSAVEWPIKALFRRRRPFIDVVRAMVIGRRPDGWSFPSGHTAAAFSGAWVASTIWPKCSPVFFGLAATVGFSRIYVGAHYPGDVLSGAALGMIIAEAIRRPVTRVVH